MFRFTHICIRLHTDAPPIYVPKMRLSGGEVNRAILNGLLEMRVLNLQIKLVGRVLAMPHPRLRDVIGELAP